MSDEFHQIKKSHERFRKPFEESVGATLALDLERNAHGYYASPKTANLFIAFCYGWQKGEGTYKSLPATMEELGLAFPFTGSGS